MMSRENSRCKYVHNIHNNHIRYFEKYEDRLLYILLNTVVDEDVDNVGLPALTGLESLMEPAHKSWIETEKLRLRRKRTAAKIEAKREAGEEVDTTEEADEDVEVYGGASILEEGEDDGEYSDFD